MVAACLVLFACSGEEAESADVGIENAASTTAPTVNDGSTGLDDEASDDTTTTSTTAAETDGFDLSDSLWLVNGYEGVVDDQGRMIGELVGEIVGGSRTTARAADGTLYLAAGENVWSLAPGDVDLAAFDVDVDPSDPFGDLGYGLDGQIVSPPYSDDPVILDDRGGRRFEFELTNAGSTQSITATNGLTVRVVDPVGESDPEGGYLNKLETPAKLEVLNADGELEWAIEAGGSRAVWLSLIDFNGRYVMFARAPSEPADPALQHVVYDLNCPSRGQIPPEGEACTQTFWTQFGKATLVGPDLPAGDDELNPDLLEICPTMGRQVSPPLEMTDDWFGPAVFSADDRQAFLDAALAIETCDPLGLFTVETDDLAYEAGTERDGWLWTELAAALEGPFETLGESGGAAGNVVWRRHGDLPGLTMDRQLIPPWFRVDQQPVRPTGNIAVVRTDGNLVLAGQADGATAASVRDAAQQLADSQGLDVTNFLAESGPAHDDDDVAELVATIESRLSAGPGEVHLAYGKVVASPEVDETNLEELAFALSDFADGGDGTFDELMLADEVVLALGSDVAARRSRDDLAERSAWSVADADFRAYTGPFDILSRAGGPVTVGFGVHDRCASPLPAPAPPELVQLQRVWLKPAEGSIDSCLQWSSVDLFVDDAGRIRGVSLDLWEP